MISIPPTCVTTLVVFVPPATTTLVVIPVHARVDGLAMAKHVMVTIYFDTYIGNYVWTWLQISLLKAFNSFIHPDQVARWNPARWVRMGVRGGKSGKNIVRGEKMVIPGEKFRSWISAVNIGKTTCSAVRFSRIPGKILELVSVRTRYSKYISPIFIPALWLYG